MLDRGGGFRPGDIPSQMQLFQTPDAIASEVELPPPQPMRGATRSGVMVIVIAFPESAEPDPEVIFAFVGGVEAAIAKLLHVADGINCPGAVISDQDRDVETPEQAGQPEGEKKHCRNREMREDIEGGVFPEFAVPDLAHVGRVTRGANPKSGRLANQPHHMGVGKTVPRAVDVFLGVGFEVMKTMIAHPRDRVTRETDRRTGGKKEFEPAVHLKPAMGEIPVEIKRRAKAHPKIHPEHDRQIGQLEVGRERGNPQQLEPEQDDENKNIDFFVLEHDPG